MAAGQRGVLLDPSTKGIHVGTATGGSTTTIVEATADFVAAGWMAGDYIVLMEGAGAPQRIVITVVAATTLTFAAVTDPPAAGSLFMLIRPPFVQIWGSARIRHEARVPVQGVPGRAGDEVQYLNRSSRRASVENGSLYRSDVPSATRDSSHVADAQQLRSWSDAGTILSWNSLTEVGLRVRITAFEVEERAGLKGFPVTLETVEAE